MMGSFDATGSFGDCTRTMTLDDTCIAAMQTYVDSNPCDTARKASLTKYLTIDPATDPAGYEDARLRLDWFGFSICEQGCDCIPQDHANRNARMIDASRGNCQAHVHYHICQLMPGIKLLRVDDGSQDPDVSSLPNVCNAVKAFVVNNPNWVELPHVYVEDHVQDFVENYIEAEQLLELEDHWNQCFDLEKGQNRITEDGTLCWEYNSHSAWHFNLSLNHSLFIH